VLSIPTPDPDGLLDALRRVDPPVVARVEDGHVVLDPRTVLPGEDDVLLAGIRAALATRG
jgi:L-seryl-tRNA(Ser) seleniumtransferase